MKELLNLSDIYGNTLLHVACRSGNVEMMKYLVKIMKVDINQVNKQSETAIQIAEENGHKEALSWLSKVHLE